jgi:excisionase family DNA binding protein
MDKLLTPQEVAEKLGVKKSTIYSWTHQGFIPFTKAGRLLRFRETDVMLWLNKRSKKGRPGRTPQIL